MEQTNSSVGVRTIGLRPYQQAQLKATLAPYPEIDLQHLDKWSFRALAADVLVIGVDTPGGCMTVDVLGLLGNGKKPLVVTYSESDPLLLMLLRDYPGATDGLEGSGSPGFCRRLQDSLREAGATGVEIEDISAPLPETPALERALVPGGFAGEEFAPNFKDREQ